MKEWVRPGCICVLVSLLFSCSQKPAEVLLDTKSVEAPALRKLVQTRQNKLHSMVGKGTVTFDSPELGGSAWFELSLKKPDSLLVAFEGPFGIDVGKLFLSRQKYVFYNSMQNRVTTGIPSSTTIRSVIPFDLTYDQILNAFSGLFAMPTNDEGLRSYSIDGDRFLISFTCGGNVCDYWIDNESLLVTKYQMRDNQNRVVMDAVASSVTDQDDVQAPRRIVVKFPQDHRQLSIFYSSLTLNEPHPSFVFSIPSNARTTIR
jgi:outer membrane lipoprotein-sorting protein